MPISDDKVNELINQLARAAQAMERAAKSPGTEGGREDYGSGINTNVTGAERIAQQKQQLALERELADTAKEKHAIEMEMLALEIREKTKALQTMEFMGEEYQKEFAEIQKLKKEKEEYAKTQQKLNAQLEAGAGKAQQLGKELLTIGGELNGLARVLPLSTKELQGFGKGLKEGIKNGTIFTTVFAKIVSNSLAFANSLDKSTAQFKRATGAGNEYNRVIEAAGMKYLAYGVNAENAAKATTDLFSGFRDFTNLSKIEQESIITTTALMEKFSVSGQTSSQILNQATKSLGMNVGEAEQMLLNIVPLAESVGKPVTEIASDLASAAPKLAFYGANMINVFKELEAQSKATGLSVDELLGLVGEKFDTFEGAGMAVGKLNALLGGPYLNSIDMLNASESERLEMIQQSMDASGVVFDDLNKFEQKAFASAIGTDVDTLRKSLNDLDPAQQLNNMRQEELAKKAGDARDIMTKLKDAINSLVIAMGPAIEKLSGWINSISKWITENQGMAKWIAGAGLLGGLLLKLVFGRGPQRAAIAQARAVQKLAVAYGQLAAAQATANATAPRGGGGMGPGGMGGRGGMGPGGMGGRGAMGKSGRFGGRMLAGRAGMIGGGALLAGGLATNWATNKGIEHYQKKGETGKAQATSIGGKMAAGALTGAAIGTFVPVIGNVVGAVVGAALGLAAGVHGATKMGPPVKDGVITRNASGDVRVTPIDNKDNLIATKKGGALAKMGGLGMLGMMGPMGMLAAGGGMLLQKMIVKPIVDAIAESGNTNVVVKIGEKELNKQIVAALNSHQGKQAVSPFYQG
jgi:hypothetical protein